MSSGSAAARGSALASAGGAAWHPLALFVALFLAYLALAARQPDDDVFDELILVEDDAMIALRKHPATEPTLWLIRRGLAAVGIEARALPMARAWSALFMALALAGLFELGRRRASAASGLAAALGVGGTHAALHLALDPYLFYIPPGLALGTWALALGSSRAPRAGAAAVVLAALAVVYDPFVLPFAGVLAAWRRDDRRVASAALVAPGVALAAAWSVSVSWGMVSGGLHGRMSAEQLGIAWDAFFTSLLAILESWLEANVLRLVVLAMLLVALAAFVIDRYRARESLRGGPGLDAAAAGLGAVITAAFVVWWNPEQPLFYAGVAWLGAIAWLALRDPRAGRLRRVLGGAATAALLGWNVVAYVVPAQSEVSPDLELSRELSARFGPHDVIVFHEWPHLEIEYRTGVHTQGLVNLIADRDPAGPPTTELLLALADERAREGGGAYVEVGDDGSPAPPEWIRDRLVVDLDHEAFASELGPTFVVAGLRFRQIRPEREPGYRARGALPEDPSAPVPLTDWGWESVTNGYGPVEIDRANGSFEPGDGGPMRIEGRAFDRGVGAHAPSTIRVRLEGRCQRFRAWVGVDDQVGELGRVRFVARGDGAEIAHSEVLTGSSEAERVDLNVGGIEVLELIVDPAGEGEDAHYDDVADWADAELVCER